MLSKSYFATGISRDLSQHLIITQHNHSSLGITSTSCRFVLSLSLYLLSAQDVSNVVLALYGQDHQMNNTAPSQMSVGDAVAQGVINNQTLGYYMARTQLFLIAAGIDGSRLRFRQHLKTEMAHYVRFHILGVV